MKRQITQLANDFLLVELQDGVSFYEYNFDYDLFERAGSGVPLFQNEKMKKIIYKGIV